MTKGQLKDVVARVLDDHGIDDSELAVDDFLSDLVIALEYDGGFEFDDDETEEIAPGLGEED